MANVADQTAMLRIATGATAGTIAPGPPARAAIGGAERTIPRFLAAKAQAGSVRLVAASLSLHG